MNDFQEKSKRKNGYRNPYLFLGMGIAIGIVIAFALVFLFLGTSSEVSSNLVIEADAEAINDIKQVRPTVAPFNAQSVQGTPIANRIQAVAISGDGEYLAYVSVENAVSHIYLNELRVERNLTGDQYDLYQASGYFNDIVFSPDASKLIVSIDNGSTILFDVATRTVIEEYAQMGGASFSPDGKTLVLVGRNNGIRVLNIEGDTPALIDFRGSEQLSYTVGAVAVSSQNDLAIGLDSRIEIFDLNNLASAPQVIDANNGFVSDLAFHPTQSNTLAVALAGAEIQSGNVQILDLSNSSRSQFNFDTRVFAIAFSPDGEWLAVGGGESGYADSKLIAYRWDSSNNPIPADPNYYQPITFEGHEHTIFDVAFSREGYLLSAGWDGSVRMWDLFSPGNEISVYYP